VTFVGAVMTYVTNVVRIRKMDTDTIHGHRHENTVKYIYIKF